MIGRRSTAISRSSEAICAPVVVAVMELLCTFSIIPGPILKARPSSFPEEGAPLTIIKGLSLTTLGIRQRREVLAQMRTRNALKLRSHNPHVDTRKHSWHLVVDQNMFPKQNAEHKYRFVGEQGIRSAIYILFRAVMASLVLQSPRRQGLHMSPPVLFRPFDRLYQIPAD